MKHTRNRAVRQVARASAAVLSVAALFGVSGGMAAQAQETATEAVIVESESPEGLGEPVEVGDLGENPFVDDDNVVTELGDFIGDGNGVVAVSGDEAVAAAEGESGLPDDFIGTASVPSTRDYPLPAVGANPSLPKQCGLNIALVFDLSASLDSTEQQQARTAAKSLVSSLQGTDSKVGLFAFATNPEKITVAGKQVLDAPIDSREGVQFVNNAIDQVRAQYSTKNFNGGTNWEGGLLEIVKAKEAGATYDVVFFITDGKPTATNPDSAAKPPLRFNGPTQFSDLITRPDPNNIMGGWDANYTDVYRAIEAANEVKATGARIVPIGIGMPDDIPILRDGYGSYNVNFPGGPYYSRYQNQNAPNARVSKYVAEYQHVSARDTLESISSTDAPLAISNYRELEKVLVEAASETCNPSVSVRKLIVDATGETISRGEGWTFTPSGPGVVSTDSDAKVTPESGIVAWTTEKGQSITFTETMKDGYALYSVSGKNAVCTQNVTDEYGHVTQKNIPVRNTPNGFEVATPATDDGAISCVVRNYEPPAGTFSITKRVEGSGKDIPEVKALEFQMQYACWDEGHTPGVDDPDYSEGLPGFKDDVTKSPTKAVPGGVICWAWENQGDIDRLDVPNLDHSVSYSGEGVRERTLTKPINGITKVAEFRVPTDSTQKISVEVENRFDAGTFYVQKFAYEKPEEAGKDNPHIGEPAVINDDGTVNVTYYVRVKNSSNLPGTAGALADNFVVPNGLVWNGDQKATIEPILGDKSPRLDDIKDFVGSATQDQLANGLQITSGIENFPGNGEAIFKITMPLKVDTADVNGTETKFDQYRDNLSECASGTWNGKPFARSGRGVFNKTALVNEDMDSTVYPIRDNQACVPVKVPEKWEIEKQAKGDGDEWAAAGGPGSTVTVNADGTVTADYRIKVTNKSLVAAPNETFNEKFTLPEGFTLVKAGLYYTTDASANPGDGSFFPVDLGKFGTKRDGEQNVSGLDMRITDDQNECRIENGTFRSGTAPVWCRYTSTVASTPADGSFYYHLRITARTNPTITERDKAAAGECENSGEGTPGKGLFNSVNLPDSPEDPLEDNDACAPVDFPKWEVSKSAKTANGFSEPGAAGEAVTPDKDGNVTAIYRIDIHNQGKNAQSRPLVEDTPSVPEDFEIKSVKVLDSADTTMPANLTTEGKTVELVDGKLLIQSAQDCSADTPPTQGFCPTGGNTIDADGHHYVYVAVTAQADPANHSVWEKLGECEKSGNSYTEGKTFVNKVKMPDYPGEPVEDNETCVPVKHPEWEVKKSAEAAEKGTFAAPGQSGAPVVADENGNFTTLYRIEILNTGEAAGYTPEVTDTVSLPDPKFTIEKVEIVQGPAGDTGATAPADGWKEMTLGEGNAFTIQAATACEANADLASKDGSFCPRADELAPGKSTFVYVRVVARGPADRGDDAWTKIGVCESSGGGGTGDKGMHNKVVMPGDPKEPTNDNEVCIPVTKPGWNVQKLPANTDTDTYPEGYGPAGGTGTEVNPAEDGTITVNYRIDLTNTGDTEQNRPKFTDTFTIPAGFTATKITMAVSDSGTTPADDQFVTVTPKDGVVTISENDAECGAAKTGDVFCEGQKLASNTLAPNGVQHYFFRVIAVPNDDITEGQWKAVGECETTSTGTPGKGFFNFVYLPGEDGSEEDNDACVPVKPGTGVIDVIKYNQDGGMQLPGAEFTIYPDADGQPDKSTAMILAPKKVEGSTVTDEAVEAKDALGFKSGKLEFNKIYWLAETKAPYANGGYELLPEPMKFRLTASGIEVWDNGSKAFLPAGGDEKSVLGNSFRIVNTSVSVYDSRLGELPKAGGIGHWTLAGGAGLLIAISLLMAYRTPTSRRA